jgi:hypothetical protein
MEREQPDFAEFYASAKDNCLRVVLASTGDANLAEDLVAEAFARAFASWRSVSRHPAPQAWVVRRPAGGSARRRRACSGDILARYDNAASSARLPEGAARLEHTAEDRQLPRSGAWRQGRDSHRAAGASVRSQRPVHPSRQDSVGHRPLRVPPGELRLLCLESPIGAGEHCLHRILS